jgi:nifR3 family TIM-barrel protein
MLRIGNVDIGFPMVQAALSGYSDLPMRRVARLHGAIYCVNEVVLDTIVLTPGKKQRAITHVEPDDHPVGGQLMGAQPESFALAADAMVEAGYDVIDINFGCPVRKVLGRCRGGFLLSDPPTAIEIVRQVLGAVDGRRPVTVKMRRGLDNSAESEHNFFTILDKAFELGVAGVTIHGRTVQQRYVGPSRWEFLARVKKHIGDRTMLGCGDLFTAEDCVRMMSETGVDGVTIARGCIGNPWIFGECRTLMGYGDCSVGPLQSTTNDSICESPRNMVGCATSNETYGVGHPPRRAGCGPALQELRAPTVVEQSETIRRHFDWAVETHGQQLAGRIMRKFGIKYAELHPHYLDVRNAFIRAHNTTDWMAVLDEWYSPARDWPPTSRKTGPGDLVAAGAELDRCE